MSPSGPEVSPYATVVVVNWNGGGYLKRALRALQRQTIADFEVIVVDNASMDGSAQHVLDLDDSRFRLVQAERNLGFAAANNLAVRLASQSSRWIALLNPDAFPEPDWIERLLDAARRYPHAGSFASALIKAEHPTVWDGTGDQYHFSGKPARRDHGIERRLTHRCEGEIFAACAAAALYCRDAWVEVGGFDEDFFCYLEDVDLGFRLQLINYPCVFIPAARCAHVGSAITGRYSDFSTYQGQRNVVWVYVKNMPLPLFWLFLPFHILVNLAACMVFFKRGNGLVCLAAKRDALKGLARLWRKRKVLQAGRKCSASRIWALLDKGWIF